MELEATADELDDSKTENLLSKIESLKEEIKEKDIFPFILLWGERSGHIVACSIISAIVFVFLHLYQGKRLILDHVLFAVAFSVAAVVSGNIVITISMHLLLNLITTAKLWFRESKKKKAEEIETQLSVKKPAGSLAIWLGAVAISLGIFGIIELCFENATFTLLAFVLSIAAIAQARKEQKAARRLAIVALVVSSVSFFIAVILPMIIMVGSVILILLWGIFG